MISMTTWIYIIKTLLRSDLTKAEIRDIILFSCLNQKKKIWGAYSVDAEKIWQNIIQKDRGCLRRIEELNLKDINYVMAYYEEIEYQKMRLTYPKRRRRRGK